MPQPLHLFHTFSTFDPGGPEIRSAELIAALPEGEFEHSILALDGRYGCRERVPAERVREWPQLEPGSGLRAALRIGRLLSARRPDLVLTYNWGAVEALLGALLRRLPVLHHEDGFGADEARQQKRRRALARRLLLRRARGLVVPSSNLARIAVESWRLPARRVHHIPNAIDTDHFCPGDRAAARRALDLPLEAFIVGSLGGLRPEKNHALLIEAFASLDACEDAWLALAGDGPERERLAALAAARGVASRVRFLGRRRDTATVYRALDLFALSSRTEQMPLAVLEAMACGRPVLSTRVGDVADMLSAPNRPFVVAERELGTALNTLRRDAAQRLTLGKANREHCQRTYPMEAMIAAYRRLYRAAASNLESELPETRDPGGDT